MIAAEKVSEAPRDLRAGGVPPLRSEIPGVSDEAWTSFAVAMRRADPSTVSEEGEVGMFGLKMRRLADLNLVRGLRKVRSPGGKTMTWVGEWTPPLDRERFLASPRAQYRVFSVSMARYAELVRGGDLPRGATLSGALAILHRCGPPGLRSWSRGQVFPRTADLFQRVNGIF